MPVSFKAESSAQGRKLDQYRISARSQLRVGHKASQWAGFATAAGAALAMSTVADATVIYSGAQNQTFNLTDGNAASTNASQDIDLDGDGNVDLTVNLEHHTSAALSANFSGVTSLGGGAFLQAGTPGVQRISGFSANSFGFVNKLSSGQSIGPIAAFPGSSSDLIAQGQFAAAGFSTGVLTGSTLADPGAWALSSSAFAGIRFQHAGNDHFGWIRLHFADASGNGLADTATIVDWAWNDSVGAPIQAGSTPEPAPLALLAAGAVGLGTFRRRKRAAETPQSS